MKGKYYGALRYRKTPTAQRGKYIYEFADGERVTITAADEAVTEVDIRMLHRIDDHEVYINIKGSRPPMEDWQRDSLEQWKAAHPDEEPDKGWNTSLDALLEGDDGEDDATTGYLKTALYEASEKQASSSPVERMAELVSTMKPRLQAVYQLAMLDRIPNTKVASMLGVSEGMIRKDIKAIQKIFREDRILRSFFH